MKAEDIIRKEKYKDLSNLVSTLKNSVLILEAMEEYANEKVKQICVHDEIKYVHEKEEHECIKCGAFIEVYK